MSNTDTLKANPFMHAGFWFWSDEQGKPHGPYHTQVAALWGLMRHIDPPFHVWLWRKVKEFARDTRG